MDNILIVVISFFCLGSLATGFIDELVNSDEQNLDISRRIPSFFKRPPSCGTVGCGFPNTRKKIVGGHVTVKNEYPWMVGLHDTYLYLRKGAEASQFCGGAIVSKKWVVTAAHCTLSFKKTPWSLLVTIGRHDLSSFALFDSGLLAPRVARKIIVHPDYSVRTTDNDISLVSLLVSVHWTKLVRPVCFPSLDPELSGQSGVATGWGSVSEGGPSSSVLLEVTVPLITNEECQRKYTPSKIQITSRMLCAAMPEGGKDSCQGDSGGPLTLQCGDRYLLIGVVSFGIGCAHSDYPGVYARVTSYREWIYGYVGETYLCTNSCAELV